MTVNWQETTVGGSRMRVYLSVPSGPGPHPGVVLAQHGSGVDAFVQDVVHRLHREGYAVAAPELFHRQPVDGLGTMERIGMLRDDEIIADMTAALALLEEKVPALGKVGVVGHCMGGRVAFLMACVEPRYSASVMLHGGNIRKAWGDGPTTLERASGIAAPMLGLFGGQDTNPSPEDVAVIGAELTRLGKWHEFHSYADAGHAFGSFTNAERYRPRASRAAWGELLAFFDDQLKV